MFHVDTYNICRSYICSVYKHVLVSLLEIIFHDFKGIVGSEALNPKLINVAKHFHLLNDFDFSKNNNKKKIHYLSTGLE